MSRDVGAARGVLRSAQAAGDFHHARIAPSSALEHVVQHYWSVRWDLQGGPPQVRETLPHPNVQLVIERRSSGIYGVHTGRFTVSLADRGEVFGVKFRAGGFRGFLRASVSALRNRSRPLEAVFGPEARTLGKAVRDCADDIGCIALAEHFLGERLPPPDADADLAACIVDGIAAQPEILRVEDVLARWPMGKRSLQRLFSEYVGIGAKWVINRYRMHEALVRLASASKVDWAAFALELGYCDQAHFIRDFKALIGQTPADYLARRDPECRKRDA